PQIKAWTDFCFYRESLCSPYDDPGRTYTVFAASTEDGRIFFGSVPFRVSETHITWEQITGCLEEVKDEQLFPPVGTAERTWFTVAPGEELLPRGWAWVGRNLRGYEDFRKEWEGEGEFPLARKFLEETKILELILRNPTKTRPSGIWGHPNIAEYIGVKINRSRITGLVFAKYRQNLWEYLLQRQHERGVGIMTSEHQNMFIADLEDAILNYLHKELNVAHNDINPGNIMVEFRGGRPVPFLTGFGMARKVGKRILLREKEGMEETFLRNWGWGCEEGEYERSERRHDV
ncbi:hypothetical protein B0T20DRAFT_346130, partial [Sordaria brevicollis]